MANRRMIASDIFEDDFIGGLSFFERLLWIGIITSVADDQGRMMDNPALIRSKVFLFDSILDSEVESALRKINAASKIVRYIVGNKALIQIVNWWKYQTPSWASPSKYPPPPEWTDRAKYHAVGNKVITCNWDNIGGYISGYIPPVDRAINESKGEERRGEEYPAAAAYSPAIIDTQEAGRIYMQATGLMALPSDKQGFILETIIDLYPAHRNGEKLIDYLKPFYTAWCGKKGKNGNGYSRVNPDWLNWAIAGEIPGANKQEEVFVETY
jgi:hypothetical protein